MRATMSMTPCEWTMSGVDNQDVNAGIDQRLPALERIPTHRWLRRIAVVQGHLRGVRHLICFWMSLTVIRPFNR